MKSKLFFMAGLMAASLSFSMGSKSPELSKRDRETLQFSKNMMRHVDSIQWQIGLDVYDVDGPEKFVEEKVGIYYTGRVKVKRWGENMDIDVKDYQWDADAGERWHVLREAVYYDRDQMAYSLGYQGPNVLPEFYNVREYTEEFLGVEPDWSVFK